MNKKHEQWGCLVAAALVLVVAVDAFMGFSVLHGQPPLLPQRDQPLPASVYPGAYNIPGLAPEALRETQMREEIVTLQRELRDLRNVIGHLQWTVYGPERYRQMSPLKSATPPWWSDAEVRQYKSATPHLLELP